MHMVLNEHIFESLFVQYIFKNNEVQLRTMAEIIQLFLKLNYGAKVRIIDKSIHQNTKGRSRNSRSRFSIVVDPKCRVWGHSPSR